MALRAAVFWFTVATDNPSPGSQLMGLQYRNELAAKGSRSMGVLSRLQKVLFAIATVLLPYLSRRFDAAATENSWATRYGDTSWRMRLVRLLRRCSELHKLVSSLHLLSFMLLDGRYRSPIEQLVGARLVPAQRHGARGSMPFDFLNQQLVFNGLTEFTRWAVPVFSAAQSKMLALGNSLVHHMQPSAAHTPSVASDPASWAHDCSVCDASPAVMGFAGSCGHVGCYVCLRAAVMDDPHARCSRCGVALSTLRRYEPWSVNTDT
eukprot:TRINITY_DN4951_c0_g2_i1.p1 TRINITY_DN4951_c0_g2~~TRINITY_DN4951_c0_g2_i1.p1  ORF type:complete len:264 (-),score=39.60 TRINITY_DN4951_c0_g2_i1:443-1234(-)